MSHDPHTEELLAQREVFVMEVFELCFGINALPYELNTEDRVHDENRRPSYSYGEALDRLKEFEEAHHKQSDGYGDAFAIPHRGASEGGEVA